MIIKFQHCWDLFFTLVGDEGFLAKKKMSMHSADRENGKKQGGMNTIWEQADQELSGFGGPELVWGLSTMFCRM